jgi:hypothetical protein
MERNSGTPTNNYSKPCRPKARALLTTTQKPVAHTKAPALSGIPFNPI